jgi:hypothetical protein
MLRVAIPRSIINALQTVFAPLCRRGARQQLPRYRMSGRTDYQWHCRRSLNNTSRCGGEQMAPVVPTQPSCGGNVRLMVNRWFRGGFRERLESARLARCRASRRRSLDRTDSSHTTVAKPTALHALQPPFTIASGIGSVGTCNRRSALAARAALDAPTSAVAPELVGVLGRIKSGGSASTPKFREPTRV